jgi:transposase
MNFDHTWYRERAIKIVRMRAEGQSIYMISVQFGISETLVYEILSAWRKQNGNG